MNVSSSDRLVVIAAGQVVHKLRVSQTALSAQSSFGSKLPVE